MDKGKAKAIAKEIIELFEGHTETWLDWLEEDVIEILEKGEADGR